MKHSSILSIVLSFFVWVFFTNSCDNYHSDNFAYKKKIDQKRQTEVTEENQQLVNVSSENPNVLVTNTGTVTKTDDNQVKFEVAETTKTQEIKEEEKKKLEEATKNAEQKSFIFDESAFKSQGAILLKEELFTNEFKSIQYYYVVGRNVTSDSENHFEIIAYNFGNNSNIDKLDLTKPLSELFTKELLLSALSINVRSYTLDDGVFLQDKSFTKKKVGSIWTAPEKNNLQMFGFIDFILPMNAKKVYSNLLLNKTQLPVLSKTYLNESLEVLEIKSEGKRLYYAKDLPFASVYWGRNDASAYEFQVIKATEEIETFDTEKEQMDIPNVDIGTPDTDIPSDDDFDF